MNKIISFFKQFDWALFFIIFALLAIGLTVQYSLASRAGEQPLSNFTKQSVFAAIGLALFFVIGFFDYRALKNYAYFLYPLALLLLIAVLVFGRTIRGTTGWIPLGIFNLQAVELVKVLLIVIMAKYWSKRVQNVVRFKDIVFSGLLIFPPIGLVLLQPDLGSAVILVGFWLAIMIMANHKLSYTLIVLALIAAVIFASWFFFLKDYQKNRVLTFLNPQRDPLGQGYQITQSIVAVGSGQFFGRGLGLGPQSQLRFLPAAETDFVFAVIAEELGLAGSLLVLGLFAALFRRLIKIARGSFDNFGLFLVLGIISAIFIQLVINIGMNIGLAPIMGIPLPLISYGGSSLVTTFMALGLAQSMAVHKVKSSRT